MAESQLTPARLEAFSDGVLAVIITIMVLELHVPATGTRLSDLGALRTLVPLLLVYLLSFVQIGIWWVNHHYLIDGLKQVTHGMLWSNLALLFCLSLVPFTTRWVAERGISAFSAALYASSCALPGVAWLVLSTLICRHAGVTPVGSFPKQIGSAVLYFGAIPAAYLSPYLSLGMVCLVAVIWLAPPRRIVEITRSTRAQHPHPH